MWGDPAPYSTFHIRYSPTLRHTLPIARTYYELLRYVFKRFSVHSAARTALPTLGYYARRPALPPSEKPALFTMNILPPMMTVWHHCVRKYLGDEVDVVIFDCSGTLDPAAFPGARVQKFLNLYAATKTDEFLYHIAKNRRLGWMCDDDMFPLSPTMLDRIRKEFADPSTASLSFRARPWWHYEISGKHHEPSSSYCTVINRDIYCDREHLSLAPRDGNPHPTHIGRPQVGRYDTFDDANEQLLRKGYTCAIVPKEEEDQYLTGFSGMSGAVMLLHYFRTPEQTLDYLRSPSQEHWRGNVLYGVLAGLLAITTIQECYAAIRGTPYPLPSLPTRSALEAIRHEREPFLREDQSLTWVDETSERLKGAL